MNFHFKKLIGMTLIVSFLGLDVCFANSYPQQYGNNIEAKLEQAFEQQSQNADSDEAEEYSYLRAGQNLAIELTEEIDSDKALIGDNINARLIFPLEIDNKIIAPEGSSVSGKIIQLEKSGMWYQNAKVQIVFEEIDCGEDFKLPIEAIIKTKDNSGILFGGNASEQIKGIISLLSVTSIGGVLIGLGFGLLTPYVLVGCVVGGVVGFSLGLLWSLFHKGEPVHIPSGTKLVITLENDVAVSGFEI